MVKLFTDIFASKAKSKGLKRAGDNLLAFYNRGMEQMEPWQDQGEWALTELKKEIQNGAPAFETTPEHQFALQQGADARNNAAAAAGSLDSGGHQKNMTQYGQNTMMQYQQQHRNNWLQNRVSPLFQMSSAGQAAAAQMAQMSMNVGSGLADNEISKGNAKAGMINGIGTNLTDIAMKAVGGNMFGSGDMVAKMFPASIGSGVPADSVKTGSSYGDLYSGS